MNITTLLNENCELGENPLWNVQDGSLYWEDIDGCKIHRFNLASGKHQVIYHGERVGGFTFQANGDLLLFRIRDLALLRPDGQVKVLCEYFDEGMERFNDVMADPEGRVYAGTIGITPDSGGLYRVDQDGTITLLFRGSGCSNGMGFSPDLTKFYWTCSTRRRIFEFDYARSSGALSRERVFYQATPDEGIPDGMTVDNAGHIWSARWDGYAVIHHGPDGKVVEKFSFPVAKVTSLCFGGPNLDQFFVTTAGGKTGSNTEDGSVYQWSAGVSGRAEFRSRIGLP